MTTLSPIIISAAQASHAKFYPRGPFASVTLAQFGLESSWGAHLSGTFNPFGIKANEQQIAEGKFTTRITREQTPSGQVYTIDADFANYSSWTEAFDAHATLLTSPHYHNCIAAKTPEEYCYALKADGYATAVNYATALIGIINSMNLKQYDAVTEPVSAPATTNQWPDGYYWAKAKGQWLIISIAHGIPRDVTGTLDRDTLTLGPAITRPTDLKD